MTGDDSGMLFVLSLAAGRTGFWLLSDILGHLGVLMQRHALQELKPINEGWMYIKAAVRDIFLSK